MRQLLTIFPEIDNSFSTEEQLIYILEVTGVYTPALEDFIRANDSRYWDRSEIRSFVLAVYS